MLGHVILAGGSGFLGQSLAQHLATVNIRSIVLTRSRHDRAGFVHWDGITVGAWTKQLENAAAIINLTGRSVDCRNTKANRREIIDSRVHSVRAIGAALRQCDSPPPLWIQASSLAIYGDAGDRICADDAPHGSGFSVKVCEQWEEAFHQLDLRATRSVVLRIGFALAANGGALGRLAALTRFGLGGTVGGGRQFISWLHIDDLNRIFAWCLSNENASGIYNATSPDPVANAVFMAALRPALCRPWSPPAPSIAVKIGAHLMGTDASLALTGRRCVPRRLLDEGFKFHYTDLGGCLRSIFATKHQVGET